MRVLAAPGINVPLEDHPRQYITDAAPEGESAFTVPDSAYYLRRVSDGDLIEVADASAKPAKKEAR